MITRWEIGSAVAFGVGWVAEKDAGHIPRCELVRGSGSDAGVAQATENTELSIGRWRAKQEVMRCKVPASATRTNVDE